MRSEKEIKEAIDQLTKVVSVVRGMSPIPPTGILLMLSAASALEWVLELEEAEVKYAGSSFVDLLRMTDETAQEIEKRNPERN